MQTINYQNVISSRGCDYYDYTDATVEQWRESLERSETNTYTFLAENIALSATGAIRKYESKCVYTWMA